MLDELLKKAKVERISKIKKEDSYQSIDIPNGWNIKKLGEISDIKRGASPRPIDSPKWFDTDSCIGWIRISDVNRSYKYLKKTTQYLSEAGIKKSVAVKKGELILSICATVGVPIILHMDACIHDGFVVFENIDRNVSKEYLFYALIKLRNYFLTKGQTGTQSNLNTNIIKNTELIIPSLKEQTNITHILSTLDNVIEKTEALIEKEKKVKKGLMQDLFTRGVLPDGRLRPPVSIAPNLYKKTKIGYIPKEWEIKRFNDVCVKIQDGTHFSPRTYLYGDYRYVTSKNIKFGYLDLSTCEYVGPMEHQKIYRYCPVEYGDVLLTKDGVNTGNAALNSLKKPFSLLSSVAIIRSNSEIILNEFMLQYILSEIGQQNIKHSMSGLAIKRVTLEKIKNFLVIVPSIFEQSTFINILKPYDNKIKKESEYKKKLVTGQAIL